MYAHSRLCVYGSAEICTCTKSNRDPSYLALTLRRIPGEQTQIKASKMARDQIDDFCSEGDSVCYCNLCDKLSSVHANCRPSIPDEGACPERGQNFHAPSHLRLQSLKYSQQLVDHPLPSRPPR